MKRILSFFLIIGFVLVLSPRTVFHSHAHEHEHHEIKKSSGGAEFDADCLVCDLDLSLFTPSQPFHLSFIKDGFAPLKSIPTQVANTNYSPIVSLRGPPRFV
ncbi:hypothetical protein N9F27_00175 [Crocinitomicaceae bacterium]|nr:hypothetical protein [Crocinitomicaceae bacterium]MDG2464694.1 hypothetical protein [Crocinitomicaceae bacterium]